VDENLINLKNIQIESVKLAARHQITAVYPIEKQINILRLGSGYTEQDQTEMAQFVDSIRAQSEQFEQQINELFDSDDLAGLQAFTHFS
jgi:hypothetical protein